MSDLVGFLNIFTKNCNDQCLEIIDFAIVKICGFLVKIKGLNIIFVVTINAQSLLIMDN